MFVRRILIEQVIKLFEYEPSFRDDRYGTIVTIVKRHYVKDYGKSVVSDYKLTSDIDRAFRLIQQEVPQLRGKTWVKRQRKAGEITREEYEFQTMGSEVKKIAKQLHLFSKS